MCQEFENLSLITFWSSPPNSSKTWKAKKPFALWKNRGITRSNSGVCVRYEYILCFVLQGKKKRIKMEKRRTYPLLPWKEGESEGCQIKFKCLPLWQRFGNRVWKGFQTKVTILFLLFFHIMKCTSLLTSQHDCLDLCNQMVMREEGVSRVAKTNSNVPHFARDLATEYGRSSDKNSFPRNTPDFHQFCTAACTKKEG